MKKIFVLLVLAIVAGFFGAVDAAAQSLNAKDLFNSASTEGSEGAKICVLLKRGNQPEKIVSTNETFYSGDKIKLVFDINFSGYAAILNIGPGGNEKLLFPYLDSNRRMVSHQVSPNAGTQLPRGNNWIVFDSKTGTEQITVVFSNKSIVELGKYEEAVTPGSDGLVASEEESNQILAELNSKSLSKQKSKDLYTQANSDGTYGVTRNGLGNEPVAFTFYLTHK